MKILVLYKINYLNVRNTILEHLYCFEKYLPDVQFHYFNVSRRIPGYLTKLRYDGVIFHYTYLAERYITHGKRWQQYINNAGALQGCKVLLPQDEYDHTAKLWNLCKNHGMDAVFTCAPNEEEYLKTYPPEKTGLKRHGFVFTGYLDTLAARKWLPLCRPYKDRPIDIGYRARKLPYNYGRHSQLKYELVEIFKEKLKGSGLNCNLENTVQDFSTVFHGEDWYRFLLECKAFLGCEGGSSILDPERKISAKVADYMWEHPAAGFEEVEKACFPGEDYRLKFFALSPRHFEAIATKTCQVLVEGSYGGILLPGVHYIELKRDFSNIDGVLEQLKDEKYCQQLIDRAYEDIVLSGKASYKTFAEQVVGHIAKNRPAGKSMSDAAFKRLTALFAVRNFLRKCATHVWEYGVNKPLEAAHVDDFLQRHRKLRDLAIKVYDYLRF